MYLKLVDLSLDENFMLRVIDLASLGLGKVSPNPMVGCVIVKDGDIIGEGWHKEFGGPHAEIRAIEAVREAELLKRATLYVNLEPCAHTGKTPPCANRIIEEGIPRVVVGCRDPFPLVGGRGIEQLREAGVDVCVGVLEEECRTINEEFFRRYEVSTQE